MGHSDGVHCEFASGSPDPGSRAAVESGKRLSDSRWTFEHLGCRSETEAGGGSPEQIGAADSQRAISLDAAECLAETSNPSGTALVRSTALEDLTSIEDRILWVNQREEQTKENPSADGENSHFCVDSKSRDVQQSPRKRSPTQSRFNSEELLPTHISEEDRLFTKQPREPEAESSADSSLHKESHSDPDISNQKGSRAAQPPAEPQKSSSQSSAARKSLVPVAVLKGLFAVRPHPLQFFNSSHSFDL